MVGAVQEGAQAGGFPTGGATPQSRSIWPLLRQSLHMLVAHLSLVDSGRAIDNTASSTISFNTGPDQVSLPASQVRKRRRLVLTTLHHRSNYEASHLAIQTSSTSPPTAPYRPFTITGRDAFKTSVRGLLLVSLDLSWCPLLSPIHAMSAPLIASATPKAQSAPDSHGNTQPRHGRMPI